MITVNKYNVIDQDDSTDLKVKDDGKKYGFEIGKIFVKVRTKYITQNILFNNNFSK